MKNPISLVGIACIALLICGCSKKAPAPLPVQPDVIITGITPNNGPAGTEVTITGSGFSTKASEITVTLNSISCPVIAAKTSELKITIPDKAGSGKILVKVKIKTGETKLFTYSVAPVLAVTTMSPNSGPKATEVMISGSGFSANASENTVAINGLACPVITATTSSLKIAIPVKAGSGKIHISVKGVTTETPLFTYVFNKVITTLAGSVLGDDDKFRYPAGLAVDAAGNVYVADTENGKIKKVTPAGVVRTLAGDVNGGDGINFFRPYGVAVDAAGNVYVADTENHKIKKITSGGVVSLFAGSNAGDGDKFYFPKGIAVDAAGNVYVADTQNNKIKKISPAGVVSTLAGSKAGDGEKFDHPTGVAVGKDGIVYVVDQSNNVIKKISTAGVVSTLAGTIQNNDIFYLPFGLTVDQAGTVYVADESHSQIKTISPEGVVSTLAGTTQGDGDNKFNFVSGVALDAAGNIYLADQGNHKIKKIVLE